jgi:threonyl-tRNA synthetase
MSSRLTPRERLQADGTLDPHVVAVRADGKIVDLHTPIGAAIPLTPIRDTDKDAIAVIRHSTAHVMADAVQRLFPGTHVTIGPAIEDGFYYDFEKQGAGFTDDDLRKIEEVMAGIVRKNSPFRREVIARDEAIRMFEKMGEHFKVEIIRSIPPDEEVSLYRHGGDEQWIDVCEGPHVPSTGFLKAVKLTHVAGAYWRGDERNPMLQRIYGTAFSSKEALDEHPRLIEEAKARDHRKLGKELDLFMFDPVAPAMPFFLPKGAFVYNRMIQYLRDLYEGEGYEEVITPQIFDPKLFRTSGHLGNYNENMFRLWTEDELEDIDDTKVKATEVRAGMQQRSFGLKPMNCPSHCVIFGSRRRSYRELPWRVADFGRLHRYERGGVVHGLARVRSFAQDDAHLFCAESQVASEIERFMRFFHAVYKAFGFDSIDVKLATRPENRIGSDELWDRAEKALATGLEQAGLAFETSPGESPRAIRARIHGRRREGPPPRDASSRGLRLARALLQRLPRTLRGELSDVDRAAPGDRAHRERQGRRLCQARTRAAARAGLPRRRRPVGRQARREDPQRPPRPLSLPLRRRREGSGGGHGGGPLARQGGARGDLTRRVREEARRREPSA